VRNPSLCLVSMSLVAENELGYAQFLDPELSVLMAPMLYTANSVEVEWRKTKVVCPKGFTERITISVDRRDIVANSDSSNGLDFLPVELSNYYRSMFPYSLKWTIATGGLTSRMLTLRILMKKEHNSKEMFAWKYEYAMAALLIEYIRFIHPTPWAPIGLILNKANPAGRELFNAAKRAQPAVEVASGPSESSEPNFAPDERLSVVHDDCDLVHAELDAPAAVELVFDPNDVGFALNEHSFATHGEYCLSSVVEPHDGPFIDDGCVPDCWEDLISNDCDDNDCDGDALASPASNWAPAHDEPTEVEILDKELYADGGDVEEEDNKKGSGKTVIVYGPDKSKPESRYLMFRECPAPVESELFKAMQLMTVTYVLLANLKCFQIGATNDMEEYIDKIIVSLEYFYHSVDPVILDGIQLVMSDTGKVLLLERFRTTCWNRHLVLATRDFRLISRVLGRKYVPSLQITREGVVSRIDEDSHVSGPTGQRRSRFPEPIAEDTICSVGQLESAWNTMKQIQFIKCCAMAVPPADELHEMEIALQGAYYNVSNVLLDSMEHTIDAFNLVDLEKPIIAKSRGREPKDRGYIMLATRNIRTITFWLGHITCPKYFTVARDGVVSRV
jgi:hypothetical protein